jgi:large subunit ribosomal protein L30
MSAAKKGSSAKRKKARRLHITLTKSPIGYSERQKRTVRALGLRRMHQTVEQEDTPVIRGMIDKVKHLLTVEELG